MAQSRDLPVIGVVGGIGSGKSSVSRGLADRRPVVIIDADQIGHALLLDSSVKQQLSRQFGPSIFEADGSVRRSAIADVVFGETAEHAVSRTALNSILHPLIKKEVQRQIDLAGRDGHTEAVILDAALMLETGWSSVCDAIVFVDVPEDIRRQRVIKNRGWSAEDFASRESTQFSIDKKKSFADFFLDNSKTPEDAALAFEHVLDTILSTHSH